MQQSTTVHDLIQHLQSLEPSTPVSVWNSTIKEFTDCELHVSICGEELLIVPTPCRREVLAVVPWVIG